MAQAASANSLWRSKKTFSPRWNALGSLAITSSPLRSTLNWRFLLGPAWETVLDALRDMGWQPRPEVAFAAHDPKKSLEMAAAKARVKLAPHVFKELGIRVSIPALEQSTLGGRLSNQLESWFPWLPAA